MTWAAEALQTRKTLGPTSLQAMNIAMIKALQAGAATYGDRSYASLRSREVIV